jgi:3-deoxy-D-manno-octulosonic-acid transferase
MIILDSLYFLLLLLVWPFCLKYVLKRSYRLLLRGRLRPQLAAPAGRPLWIHAVSVGEVRSLGALIASLREAGQPVVLSVTTPAGFDFARREYPAIAVIHSPLDLSFVVRRFIERIQPRLVIFNELEIWPNWISLLHRRRIPMLLINGRISAAAFRRYRLFAWILRPFFRRLDGYLVQNETYRQRFLRLGIPAGKITICGNLKADEADSGVRKVPPPAQVRAHLRLPAPARRIVVLASSHDADEKVFIPAIPASDGDYYFIIVPRHVQRAPAIAARLRESGVRFMLFSRPGPDDAASQAMIYDRMGYLVPILSIADIVFMGGTFDVRIGGHNLYEPAALGRAIVGGPHLGSFPDIGRELVRNGGYRQVGSSEEWRSYLQGLHQANLAKAGEGARLAVSKRRGSLACTLDQIRQYLA